MWVAMFSKEKFGARLLEARKRSNETQTDLATCIETTKRQFSEKENGKQTTTAEKIALICEHYNISSDYLLGLTDDPEPKGQKNR